MGPAAGLGDGGIEAGGESSAAVVCSSSLARPLLGRGRSAHRQASTGSVWAAEPIFARRAAQASSLAAARVSSRGRGHRGRARRRWCARRRGMRQLRLGEGCQETRWASRRREAASSRLRPPASSCPHPAPRPAPSPGPRRTPRWDGPTPQPASASALSLDGFSSQRQANFSAAALAVCGPPRFTAAQVGQGLGKLQGRGLGLAQGLLGKQWASSAQLGRAAPGCARSSSSGARGERTGASSTWHLHAHLAGGPLHGTIRSGEAQAASSRPWAEAPPRAGTTRITQSASTAPRASSGKKAHLRTSSAPPKRSRRTPEPRRDTRTGVVMDGEGRLARGTGGGELSGDELYRAPRLPRAAWPRPRQKRFHQRLEAGRAMTWESGSRAPAPRRRAPDHIASPAESA